jgi:DNA ligase 1
MQVTAEAPDGVPAQHEESAPKCTQESNGPTPTESPIKSVHEALVKPKKGDTVKVDGVGAGAVAAASLHSGFDVEALTSGHRWEQGAPVPYAFLVSAFNEIAPESKRLAIIATLTNAFRCVIQLTPEDLLPMVYLCASRVRPAFCVTWNACAAPEQC